MQSFLIAFFILFSAACNRSQAQEVFAPSGKAINGYDPVAFFTESKPVKGTDANSYQWHGATWYFASPQNLDSFKTAPEKYAPQYGGYCAYGTAEGHKAPTKPETWTIEDGKLYFNYNLNVKKEWDKNRKTLIQKADANWPIVKNEK
jgi:YHS domain-containing protein